MRTNLQQFLGRGIFILLLALAPCRTALSDAVRMLDDPTEAGAARVDIIQQAQKTIDVEYYAIQEGKSADLFLGLLFEAADRGVRVTPTPNLKPLIGGFKVEPAVPWFVFRRPTSRLFLMPSRSVARPRRGGPEGRGRSAATASLVLILWPIL